MHFLGKLLVTAAAAVIAAYILPGVHIKDSITALLLALVLAFLNAILKPILVILTIPITILTLGLFLLVINIIIIEIAANIVPGFSVDNWFYALIFSILLALVSGAIDRLISRPRNQ